MATLAPMAFPMRQPFGAVDNSRLKNLANMKNRQNAILPTQPVSLKRRHVTSESLDSENVDPSSFKSPHKRKRSEEDDVFKPAKSSQFVLNTISKPSIVNSTSAPARLDTPRSPKSQKHSTPASAPAGRSPKSKRVGILSRRRTTSSPYTRIDPPSYAKPHSNNASLSIAAALSGTISSYDATSVPIPTLEEAKPNSWFFDIHEDTEQEEMANLMEHSACTLDISDDESKAKARDDRGKENIPPMEVPSQPNITEVAQPAVKTVNSSRKDMMTDEPRTPLGDLNAADFYAEGYDASSIIIIPADGSQKSSSAENTIASSSTTPAPISGFTFPLKETETLSKTDLAALIQSTAPVKDETSQHLFGEPKQDDSVSAEADIEIWESGSAAGEAAETEVAMSDNIFAVC